MPVVEVVPVVMRGIVVVAIGLVVVAMTPVVVAIVPVVAVVEVVGLVVGVVDVVIAVVDVVPIVVVAAIVVWLVLPLLSDIFPMPLFMLIAIHKIAEDIRQFTTSKTSKTGSRDFFGVSGSLFLVSMCSLFSIVFPPVKIKMRRPKSPQKNANSGRQTIHHKE